MKLRKYRFRWVVDFASGSSNAHVVCAEDVKDAMAMFEHEWRYEAGLPKYSISAIAPDACPACLGFPYEQPEKCRQCEGTGSLPVVEPAKIASVQWWHAKRNDDRFIALVVGPYVAVSRGSGISPGDLWEDARARAEKHGWKWTREL